MDLPKRCTYNYKGKGNSLDTVNDCNMEIIHFGDKYA